MEVAFGGGAAHARLRAELNIITSELVARGVYSPKIDNATFNIETIARAYMEDVRPEAWDKFYLTPTEGKVFELLHCRKGKCVSRESIFAALYGTDPDGGPASKIIDVFICKIRSKIHGSGFWIKEDWGTGYRMLDGEAPPKKSNPYSDDWEGVFIGPRMTMIANLLKDSLGRTVSYDAFHAAGFKDGALRANICELRPKVRHMYTIEAVSRAGYRMILRDTPQPVASALAKVAA